MSRGTLDPALLLSISDTRLSRFLAGLPRPFSYQLQINNAVLTPQDKSSGLGSFPFARRYSGNRCFFLFLRVLRCFSSGGSLDAPILNFSATYLSMNSSEFPHSEISGSMLICSSPKLIAAYHVFHRLPVPRHSPCALVRLTISNYSLYENGLYPLDSLLPTKIMLPFLLKL